MLGGWSNETKLKLNSTQVEVEVEVEFSIANLLYCHSHALLEHANATQKLVPKTQLKK